MRQKITYIELNLVNQSKNPNIYFFCCTMIEWMIQFHMWNIEKPFNGSIEMKLSRPPSWGQDTQIRLQSNLTPAWAPCVSSIWFDSSRFFWGRDGGACVPWRLTQGWQFGKSTLTFVVGSSGLPPSHPPSHPLRGLSLALWPFKWPLDTVHVSQVWLFGMFDF